MNRVTIIVVVVACFFVLILIASIMFVVKQRWKLRAQTEEKRADQNSDQSQDPLSYKELRQESDEILTEHEENADCVPRQYSEHSNEDPRYSARLPALLENADIVEKERKALEAEIVEKEREAEIVEQRREAFEAERERRQQAREQKEKEAEARLREEAMAQLQEKEKKEEEERFQQRLDYFISENATPTMFRMSQQKGYTFLTKEQILLVEEILRDRLWQNITILEEQNISFKNRTELDDLLFMFEKEQNTQLLKTQGENPTIDMDLTPSFNAWKNQGYPNVFNNGIISIDNGSMYYKGNKIYITDVGDVEYNNKAFVDLRKVVNKIKDDVTLLSKLRFENATYNTVTRHKTPIHSFLPDGVLKALKKKLMSEKKTHNVGLQQDFFCGFDDAVRCNWDSYYSGSDKILILQDESELDMIHRVLKCPSWQHYLQNNLNPLHVRVLQGYIDNNFELLPAQRELLNIENGFLYLVKDQNNKERVRLRPYKPKKPFCDTI